MDDAHILGLSEWRPLARGGLAVVWEARQQSLDRLVAVKVYQRQLAGFDRSRFLREIVALGQLSDHPGIVTAYDAGILLDDRAYLVMELCLGGSLTRWLKPDHRPSAERVRQVGVQIADALAAVHDRGMLHRDVKPANILLDSYGNPRLADFGFVSVTGAESGAALGVTPAYAPPEAFETQLATPSGDVFSLAATLYALLAGGPPRNLRGPVTLEQMAELAKEPVEPIDGVDPHLMDVLLRALSQDPAERPTAARFRDLLTETVTPPTPSRRPRLVSAAHGGLAMLRSRRPKVVGNASGADQGIAVASVHRGGRRHVGVLAIMVLVAVVATAAVWLVRDPRADFAVPAAFRSATGVPSPASPGPPDSSASPVPGTDRPKSAEPDHISLPKSSLSAEPFQTVAIRGRYPAGANDFVRVQRWESGNWHAFPLPARIAETGRFTAYVELGRPGRHRLRVLHPDSGVASDDLLLVIRG